MIRRVSLDYFKRFETEQFELEDVIVLAGPNNSGKSTLLQALAVWNLAIQRWQTEKGGEAASQECEDLPEESPRENETTKKSKTRPGVRITRKDFTAIPLRELNLLWHERQTAYRKGEGGPTTKPGAHRLIQIKVEAETQGKPWELSVELRYENPELLYAIPVARNPYKQVASVAQAASIVHVPPFSGIGAEETRYDRPYQDLLIGQGKPGDILRNLLLEVYQAGGGQWRQLCQDIEELFGYRLLDPEYSGRPFIVCEYVAKCEPGHARQTSSKLDVASAGSGFHQILMLLGFFYARPASTLLLDEPDAHQHVILQKQVFDRLKLVARKRGCQLVVATHSEVILQSSSCEDVLSLYGRPHRLLVDVEREQIREALKRLSALDIVLVEQENGVLYTEGGTDLDILREWARVCKHPVLRFLERPLWHNVVGRNPREARAHHFALRAIRPHIRGVLLLDGDNRKIDDHDLAADGLTILRWRRYEVESYLVVPEALARFLRQMDGGGLFQQQAAASAEDYLRKQLPPAVWEAPLGQHDYLDATPASKTLLPDMFKHIGVSLSRSDYYQIASAMKPEEIHAEVKQVLDEISRVVGLSSQKCET